MAQITRFESHRGLVAHDCGYPLSRYTCRATRVAADLLDLIAFCRCSTGVALHPLKILVSHLPPPLVPGGVAPKFGSEKVSRYTGVSQLQLRVSRYTVQLRSHDSASPDSRGGIEPPRCLAFSPLISCAHPTSMSQSAERIGGDAQALRAPGMKRSCLKRRVLYLSQEL